MNGKVKSAFAKFASEVRQEMNIEMIKEDILQLKEAMSDLNFKMDTMIDILLADDDVFSENIIRVVKEEQEDEAPEVTEESIDAAINEGSTVEDEGVNTNPIKTLKARTHVISDEHNEEDNDYEF